MEIDVGEITIVGKEVLAEALRKGPWRDIY